MKMQTVPFLRSPSSRAKFDVECFSVSGDDVIEGRLIDMVTGAWYRIEDGIADLTPIEYRDTARFEAFCKKHGFQNDTVSAELTKPDLNVAKQLQFFSDYKDEYEVDVVESPFYDILYRVTVDRWLKHNIVNRAIVAEVGCGSGHQTLHMLGRGCNVIGVDLSEDMLREARRKTLGANFPGYADFVIGTAESLPLADAVFDAALICGSLHHFSSPPAALLRVAKALKVAGKVYLLEPHKSPVRFIFDWTMRQWPLWQEEANEDPLFQAHQFMAWLNAGGIDCKIRYSTYLPPHLFYLFRGVVGDVILSGTDQIFGAMPGVRKFAGVLIAEGTKTG